MQKFCIDTILKTRDNLLVKSPTASGKTVLFELSIIKEFGINC